MEPFALLNLLKTLLPNTENTPENSAANASNDPSQNVSAHNNAPQNKENASAAPDQPPSSASNAFLDFMEKHETRSRQIKRK